jgi:hypothetical protein
VAILFVAMVGFGPLAGNAVQGSSQGMRPRRPAPTGLGSQPTWQRAARELPGCIASNGDKGVRSAPQWRVGAVPTRAAVREA